MSCKLKLAGALLATTLIASQAQAWWFDDDGTTWPMFDFHRYGGDVNRPPITPDRPYFHGDDAVPLGLRWRDIREAELEAAADDAAVAAELRVESAVRAPRRPGRSVVHRRHQPRHIARICIPAAPAPHR